MLRSIYVINLLQDVIMSIDIKIQQLLLKKEKLNQEISVLRKQNVEAMSNALVNISEINKVELTIVLGAVLKTLDNLSNDKKEVLHNAGKNFLRRTKNKTNTIKKTTAKKE